MIPGIILLSKRGGAALVWWTGYWIEHGKPYNRKWGMKPLKVEGSCLQTTQKLETVDIQIMLQQLSDIINHAPISPNQKSSWKYYSERKSILQRKDVTNKHFFSESVTLNNYFIETLHKAIN